MKRALVTFAIGDESEALLEIALPGFRIYAERHEYELLDESPQRDDRPASWLKIPLLRELLDEYDEVLWLDADVVIVNEDWDLADEVPRDDWQALVRHFTPDGEVPNCGVWLLRPSMRLTLDALWQLDEYVDHVWWEQAALLELLGYRGRPVKLEQPTELYARTCWLGLEWNSHEERDRHPSPRFAHATAGPFAWRLDVMHRYAKRPALAAKRRGSMSKFLLTNAKIMIDGHDVSNFAFSLDTPDEREQVDVSGFSPTGTREYLPGQRDQTITIGFLQGFGTGEPHRVLQPLYESGTTFAMSVQADKTAAVGPGNPTFGGTAALYAYDGLNGQLNARGEITATFRPATGAGFAWGTA